MNGLSGPAVEFHVRCAKLCNNKRYQQNAAVAAGAGKASMTRKISIIAVALVAFVFGVGLSGMSEAQDCPRGDLDKAYCDRNGDLVADTPTDPKQLVNPPTLMFAYTPVEDPALYTKVWDGFLRHLEKVTGKKVVFFPVQSNAAEIEAMRSGRLHIAGVSTGPTPIAVNCAGYVPFAIMGTQGRHASATRWKSSCRPTARSRRRPTSRARSSPSPRRPRTPASRRRRRSAGVGIQSRGQARLSSRCSPASTTTRCSASPTRTTTLPRSPTR